jgi:hypothetical protein
VTEAFDFEQTWLAKFSTSLVEAAGEDTRQQVMVGSDALSDRSSRQAVIAWTQRAMGDLESLLDEETAQQVMTGCACRYPKEGLHAARQAYEATGDPGAAHRILQAQFEGFLRDSLELTQEHIETVVSRGWGLAGSLEGNRILATKIPKSGHLAQYLDETDPERRRQTYCHCPRVRDILKTGGSLPVTYCYCGAGFYKGIWEEIVQAPVGVEVLKSVLGGDDVCTIAVNLPEDSG